MTVKDELNKLFESLKEQRDEIEVQIHLASMEAKQQWHQIEPKWEHFIERLGVVNDDTIQTSDELVHATKVIGDEIKETYRRIVAQLKE